VRIRTNNRYVGENRKFFIECLLFYFLPAFDMCYLHISWEDEDGKGSGRKEN
jgi:hypothetical protein